MISNDDGRTFLARAGLAAVPAPHGSDSRYRGRRGVPPCRCDACRAASAAKRRARYVPRAGERGRPPLLSAVPPETGQEPASAVSGAPPAPVSPTTTQNRSGDPLGSSDAGELWELLDGLDDAGVREVIDAAGDAKDNARSDGLRSWYTVLRLVRLTALDVRSERAA